MAVKLVVGLKDYEFQIRTLLMGYNQDKSGSYAAQIGQIRKIEKAARRTSNAGE